MPELGGCQNWGGRGGSAEGRTSVSAEILLEAPPPAPEAGWCPPLPPSLTVAGCSSCLFFFKPHLCRRLSRHHHPPTTAWKQDGAKVSLQTWSCPGSPDKRDFPVFIVQDAETYSCSIFFLPACARCGGVGCCPRVVTNNSWHPHLSQLRGEPQETCQRVILSNYCQRLYL